MRVSSFSFMAILLTVGYRAACGQSPEGLYFHSADGGALRIERLPDGGFDVTPHGPLTVWHWWASMEGTTLKLEIDYSLATRELFGAEPVPDPARQYFLLEPSVRYPGGWDLTGGRALPDPDPRMLEEPFWGFLYPLPTAADRIYVRYIDRLPNRKTEPFEPPVTDALRAVALMGAARDVLEVDPEDSVRRIVYLDALVRTGRMEDLGQRLDEWETDILAGSNPALSVMASRARNSIEAYGLYLEGRNAWSAVQPVADNKLSLEELILHIPTLAGYDESRPFPASLYTGGIPNFLGAQVASKVLVTESYFQMMRGEREEALATLAGVCRMGQVYQRGETLISILIGIAIHQTGLRGMEVFILNACETPGEFDVVRRHLDMLDDWHQEWRAQDIRDRIVSEPMANVMAQSGNGNLAEVETRNLSLAARHELTRAAAIVRETRVRFQRFPDSLEDGIASHRVPHDPFDDAPLRHEQWQNEFLVWSIGPDRNDDHGLIEYDPTNGTVSQGDIVVTIPRKRRYPFSRDGFRPQTTEDVDRTFTVGLPPDNFADTRSRGLTVHPGEPPVIFSFGPDADENRYKEQKPIVVSGVSFANDPFGVPQSANTAFATSDARRKRVENEPQYDPTNGTVSNGNLYYRREQGPFTVIRQLRDCIPGRDP